MTSLQHCCSTKLNRSAVGHCVVFSAVHLILSDDGRFYLIQADRIARTVVQFGCACRLVASDSLGVFE